MSQPLAQAALLRLARYHCLLEEMLHAEHAAGITSREIAAQLGVTEESVRGDLSHVDIKGRPGSGYDVDELHSALTEFLGLTEESPFIVIGGRHMLEALPIVFPAEDFGLRPVAYYSERDEDAGVVINGLTVRSLEELSAAPADEGNVVALVACAPHSVDEVLDRLSAVGINGVLMLSPRIRPVHPDGMQVTYFRIPCALKSLAGSSRSGQACAPNGGSCCDPA
jgi:redox-sensing transcriptional repressor